MDSTERSALSEYEQHALTVARDLVSIGVPVFAAHPDPDSATGYRLPVGWQQTDTTRSLRALESWRPGMALCAVMGHTLDLIDLDPRNGTPDWSALPTWPTAYATAATPSGGQHVFVAALGVGSRDGILPGVDVKGGRPDGQGRGFAFIAPTVRASKVDGSARRYEWSSPPSDVAYIVEAVKIDRSGAALAELIDGVRGSARGRVNGSAPTISAPHPGPAWNGVSREIAIRPPARTFTREEAWAYCEPWLRQLASAPDGRRNAALNDAAKVMSHFGPEFWPVEWAWETLVGAVPPKENGRRHWDPRQTIGSAWRSAERDWRAELVEGARFPGAASAVQGNGHVGLSGQVVQRSRWVDPEPWLSGTYRPPEPTHGVIRGDGRALLYPAAWHTVIGSTGAGKSWLAVAHAVEELRAGHLVAYAHFEESTMGPTIERLRAVGISDDVIRERFVWLDCNERWAPGELADQLSRLPEPPRLLLLDGINSACTTHGQDPATVAAVGWYRAMFVMPATQLGAAVVSLGHPPKASDRQGERHGFGSTAWLDEVDGCGFRLVAGANPIRRGASGSAKLYSVKDRHGGIEYGAEGGGGREGWTYLGTLVVDDTEARTELRVAQPRVGDFAEDREPLDILADAIVEVLEKRADRAYANQHDLEIEVRATGLKVRSADMAPALFKLEQSGRLLRDPSPSRRGAPWGGQLVSQTTSEESPVL